MTTQTTALTKKRKRSSISSSSNGSDMGSGVKSESEWEVGSLLLSRESDSKNPTGTTNSSSISAAQLPELPKISGELTLETFTHKSLRMIGTSMTDQFPDNERLSEVGEMALKLAVTNYLYHKQPVIEVNGMPAARCNILSNENYETWVKHYDLQKQLRAVQPTDIYTPQETRTLFNAYVGAVYEEHGMRAVGTWISRLINPDQLPVNPDDTSPSILPPQKDVFRQFKQSNQRDVKRQKSESLGFGVPDSSGSNGTVPVPPDMPPPPLPPPLVSSQSGVYTSPPINFLPQQPPVTYGPLPPASSSKEVYYLPKFNERCAQQKLDVAYQAENQGSPHAPKWVIKCMVTGIHKGTGQGSSKQVAKEEAAKQAFFAMGWILP